MFMSRAPYASLDELKAGISGALAISGDNVEVVDAEALRSSLIDSLIYTAVFGPDELRPAAIWLIRQSAVQLGAFPASIHDLYIAGGRGEYANATAPAINVRGMTFDMARTIFESALANDARIVLFEIARSEMSYTWQRPADYAASVLAGAIKAEYEGPVFIQGDHFQAIARQYANDPDGEIQKVRDLAKEAIGAGFYNIDVDTSTLVDLSLPSLEEQQEINYRLTAELTGYIRSLEPDGVTVSIGGEIGEVGARNSTVEDLHAFMGGYVAAIESRAQESGTTLAGISKISVQTGTSHGGVVLPDGTMAQVNVDFDTLAALSAAARRDYGLGGAVQHGASTLPAEAFGRFCEANAIEVHLATAFQNQLYDHEQFPAELKAEIYAYLDKKSADERKPNQTDAQFYYTTRKRGFGPFKRQLWDMPEEQRVAIMSSLGETYSLIMQRLGVAGSAGLVDRVVKPAQVRVPVPDVLTS
jgi:fructose/tagatose bisphosphate aldolase